MESYPDVDAYLAAATQWPREIAALRPILRDVGLDELIKWGKPCYAAAGKNVLILQEMKDFLAVLFFKGALLDDPSGLLEPQGPNSRSAMRVRITSVGDVEEQRDAIRALVADAVAVEESGAVIDAPEPEPLVDELRRRLDVDPNLRSAFDSLTPGRQREYNLYFGNAKRPETRVARVEKYEAKILAGKGLRDR